MNAWGRIKCWFRGHHEWKLHWVDRVYEGNTFMSLRGSTCLGCGKHREA